MKIVKPKSGAPGAARSEELRSAYPQLAPDRRFPPLRLKSIRSQATAEEWEARVDCACAYRLVRHFLLNPFGLMYDEICASSLIKVDETGRVLWAPEFPKGLEYKFNPAGFVIHGAIHQARPEVHCVIHTHSLAGMAVASLKGGLLPMTQTAMRFDRVAYHDYEGVVLELAERERLVADVGDADVMVLRNHGLLALGETVAQAFNNIYRLERACRAQLLAQGTADEIVLPPQPVIDRTHHAYRPTTRRPYGILEWPAMRRLADRIDPSYKR